MVVEKPGPSPHLPVFTQVYVPKNVPKDEHARVLISTALRDNILFASLGQGEILEMINAMAPVDFPSGAEVIKQGEPVSGVRCPPSAPADNPCRWLQPPVMSCVRK